jgi:hypothetical protein
MYMGASMPIAYSTKKSTVFIEIHTISNTGEKIGTGRIDLQVFGFSFARIRYRQKIRHSFRLRQWE